MSMRTNSTQIVFVGLLYMCTMCACESGRSLPMRDLNAYVLNLENGLRKRVERDGILVEVLYRPKDMIIYHQLDSFSVHEWEKKQSLLSEFDYFVLRISRDDRGVEDYFASSPTEYAEVMRYFSDGIRNQMKIKLDSQIIPIESIVFVPGYGSSTSTSILVASRSRLLSNSGTCSFVIDDTKLGLGHLVFDFDIADIRKCPRLRV